MKNFHKKILISIMVINTIFIVNANATVAAYYHSIITQPTTKSPKIEVTEKEAVKEYKWSKLIKSNKLSNKRIKYNDDISIDEYIIDDLEEKHDKQNNIINVEDSFKYDEEKNMYINMYKSIVETTGAFYINDSASITVTYPYDNKTFEYADPFDIHLDPFDIYLDTGDNATYLLNDKSKVTCEESKTDSNVKICTQKFDLSALANKYCYARINTVNEYDYENDEMSIKVSLENIDTYKLKELKDQKTNTLKKSEEDTTYFVNVLYNPVDSFHNDKLSSVFITTDKSTPGVGPKIEEKDDTPSDNPENNPEDKPIKKIEEKITDIVENPLTGDNIIYTVVLGFISLTMVITLTRKLKKN